jgi:ribosome maturation factor RimP
MVVAGSGKTLHRYPQTLVIIELTVVLCATEVRGWRLIQGPPSVRDLVSWPRSQRQAGGSSKHYLTGCSMDSDPAQSVSVKRPFWAFFIGFVEAVSVRDLTELFEPVVESMGYELVGVEFNAAAMHGTLRVYIDREQGVNLDDCAAISHQLSGILDVEEPIAQAYDLEISSPGIDRPLFKITDFERYSGKTAKLKLLVGLQGRKNFKGRLTGVTDSKWVTIEVDGQQFDLPYADIAKANLVGDI